MYAIWEHYGVAGGGPGAVSASQSAAYSLLVPLLLRQGGEDEFRRACAPSAIDASTADIPPPRTSSSSSSPKSSFPESDPPVRISPPSDPLYHSLLPLNSVFFFPSSFRPFVFPVLFPCRCIIRNSVHVPYLGFTRIFTQKPPPPSANPRAKIYSESIKQNKNKNSINVTNDYSLAHVDRTEQFPILKMHNLRLFTIEVGTNLVYAPSDIFRFFLPDVCFFMLKTMV